MAIPSAALLAWKVRLAGFSPGSTATELPSAIPLGIQAFIVYPVLPEASPDPWRAGRAGCRRLTVILIAAIGFVNHTLLKLDRARGLEVVGFLGGLVNGTSRRPGAVRNG